MNVLKRLLSGAALAAVLAGACQAQPIGGGVPVVGANPSASVGTSAVNGVATTFMRSDAAPAISLGITPSWTGQHTFTVGLTITGGQNITNSLGGQLDFGAAGATTGSFDFIGSITGAQARVVLGGFSTTSNSSGQATEFNIQTTLNQSSTAAMDWISVTPTLTAMGSGAQNFLHLRYSSHDQFIVDINGLVQNNGSTVPTATGTCGVNALSGGTGAGKTTTTGACTAGQTVILTFPSHTAAATGWDGTLKDLTTTTDLCPETSSTASSITFTCTAAGSGDTLQYDIIRGY